MLESAALGQSMARVADNLTPTWHCNNIVKLILNGWQAMILIYIIKFFWYQNQIRKNTESFQLIIWCRSLATQSMASIYLLSRNIRQSVIALFV